jgi:hypothetical protein
MIARWLRPALALVALGGLLALGGCGGGSGAPNNPYQPGPAAPGPLSILPPIITAFANTPVTLTISGGAAPFFVVSSNPAVLPVAQTPSGNTIVLLPGTVTSDTAVTITVQDAIGQRATSTVTVRPAPIFNTLTIKPASSACGVNAICSGQTATASVTVTGPGGVGLPGRQVIFDVVDGDFGIQSNNPAQVIIQASPNAPTQPALLRATELTTGNQQTAQFTIVQTINGSAVLSVVPPSVTFQGADTTQCSNNFRADYYIFGGTPPYQVHASVPIAVTLARVPVLTAGGFFSAITNGTCVNPEVFSIVDASGLQTTATLNNVVGTTPPTPPTPPPPVVLSPAAGYTQAACIPGTTQFTFLITGGTTPINVSSTTGLSTPTPASITSSPGTFTVTWVGPGATGTAFVIAVDSNIQQQTATAQVTCTP